MVAPTNAIRIYRSKYFSLPLPVVSKKELNLLKLMNEKLILIISEHRQFGWKLSIHSAEPQPGEVVFLRGIPSITTEIQRGASETEITLLRTVENVSEDALIKFYSKEKEKAKISQSTIDNLIRPKIENHCAKILKLAQEANIPVYYRSNIKSIALSEFNRVEILPEPSYCLFNFVKDEKGLRYFISLIYREEEISLQQEPVVILSQEPCIILLKNRIHQVQNIESKKLTPFFTKTHIEVPVATEKAYIQRFIIKTIPKYEVKIEGIDMRKKTPQKEAILVLNEDFFNRLYLSLFYQYDSHRFNPILQKKKKIVTVEEIDGTENICWFDRDLEWENRLFCELGELELQLENNNHFYLKQKSEILQNYGLIGWINQNIDRLKNFRIEQKTAHSFYQGSIRIESKSSIKIDWFELEIEVVFDHCKIPLSRFRKHILTHNPEYVLPDGSLFIIPEEWFSRYNDLLLHSNFSDKKIQLKKIYWNILNDKEDFFQQEFIKDLESFNHVQAIRSFPSEKLELTLRSYQKEGFYWLRHLYQLKFGGCLADDMGLGKTLQTITLLASIYLQKKETKTPADYNERLPLFPEYDTHIPASLIIVPTSLLHNWKNELKKFAPKLNVYIHAGIKRLKTNELEKIFKHYHIVISSYSIVRLDVDYLCQYKFHYLILDESQYIKNPDSILYNAIGRLVAAHRLALTGTPIENSLIDLWAQFNFINPGLLSDLSSFKENYIYKITKENNRQTKEALFKLIRPFFLRRTKEEVAPDLPPISEEIVYCDMTEAQENIYIKEKNSIRNKLLENKELFVKNKIIALQSLTRLRLLSNHPALIDAEYTDDSGKLDQIILYFETIRASGHKVLIFSSFVKHLKLVAQAFEKEGWKYVMLTGQTQNREEEINKFNRNSDVNCFFISLKAGGTGLNLTAADYVFIIDPWWNPAAEIQALSRSHRIGQNKSVMVYRFISSDSVEEKILHLQEKKNLLSETFIVSNNPLENLNFSEIEELL